MSDLSDINIDDSGGSCSSSFNGRLRSSPVSENTAILLSAPPRALSLLRFVCVAFFIVCGGPFGLEEAVGAGGILPVIILILLLPIIWAIPQALVVAELSTMMSDVNGGYVVWVFRGLGILPGIVNTYNGFISCLCDISLYPNLIVAYLPIKTRGPTAFLVKVLISTLVTILNIFGISTVGIVSIALAMLTMSVFVVEIPFALSAFTPASFTSFPATIDWGLLTSVMLWSYTGWDSLGSFACEVENPNRTYPLGIALTLLVSSLAYLVPITFSYMLLPDPKLWNEDALLQSAKNTSLPWLPVCVSFASFLSNLGQMNAQVASHSRAMWAMGCEMEVYKVSRTGPRFLSVISKRFGTPVNALLTQLVAVSLLALFQFSELIVFEMWLSCISLLIEFSAFLALRYREPLAERPFLVPGGLVGAWAVTLVKAFAVLFTMASMSWSYPMTSVSAVFLNIIMVIAYIAYRRRGGCGSPLIEIMDKRRFETTDVTDELIPRSHPKSTREPPLLGD